MGKRCWLVFVVFVAQVQAELWRPVCSADLHGNFGAGDSRGADRESERVGGDFGAGTGGGLSGGARVFGSGAQLID